MSGDEKGKESFKKVFERFYHENPRDDSWKIFFFKTLAAKKLTIDNAKFFPSGCWSTIQSISLADEFFWRVAELFKDHRHVDCIEIFLKGSS